MEEYTSNYDMLSVSYSEEHSRDYRTRSDDREAKINTSIAAELHQIHDSAMFTITNIHVTDRDIIVVQKTVLHIGRQRHSKNITYAQITFDFEHETTCLLVEP